MKIDGKKLAWSILFLSLFLNELISDLDIFMMSSVFGIIVKPIFYYLVLIFLAWRFIVNLDEVFK